MAHTARGLKAPKVVNVLGGSNKCRGRHQGPGGPGMVPGSQAKLNPAPLLDCTKKIGMQSDLSLVAGGSLQTFPIPEHFILQASIC